MVVPRFRDDPVVDALRWMMVAVMLAGGVLTLAGQPSAFWKHPELAVRHDGLGVHHPTNHAFEFLLSHGPLAFILCLAAYITIAVVLASILPRKWAIVFILTAILSHNYTGTNWFAIRWHLGLQASLIYGLGVGLPLAMVMAEPSAGADVQRRMAWIAAATLLADMVFTLLGQPHSYWTHPETVYEGNSLSRFFLSHGWESFLVYVLAYAYLLHRAVVLLPRLAGLTVACCYVLASFDGAGNWLFFVWRRGMPAIIAYAIAVSVALLVLVFRQCRPDGAPMKAASRRLFPWQRPPAASPGEFSA